MTFEGIIDARIMITTTIEYIFQLLFKLSNVHTKIMLYQICSMTDFQN